MASLNSRGATGALVTGHMAGMIDMPALPVWVGTLIAGYGFAPAQAGGLATLFLGGVVLSSVLLARFFHRMPGRWVAPFGFGGAAAVFFVMARLTSFADLAAGHLAAGFLTGMAVSVVHGTMARTASPHRVFAMGGMALGVMAILLFAVGPVLIAARGPGMLFLILGGIMAVGALVGLACFPTVAAESATLVKPPRFDRPVWFAITGIVCMALTQAMIFSFVERVGADHGFPPAMVQRALIVSGFVSATPALLAALLEHRLRPLTVAMVGAALQGVVACTITWSAGDAPYFLGVAVFSFIMLFSHTFIFGHLARIEPTGRANAATPAMIMAGSATGPLIGGLLIQTNGYPALGLAAAAFAALAILAFSRSRASAPRAYAVQA